jgi:hypothetical protein
MNHSATILTNTNKHGLCTTTNIYKVSPTQPTPLIPSHPPQSLQWTLPLIILISPSPSTTLILSLILFLLSHKLSLMRTSSISLWSRSSSTALPVSNSKPSGITVALPKGIYLHIHKLPHPHSLINSLATLWESSSLTAPSLTEMLLHSTSSTIKLVIPAPETGKNSLTITPWLNWCTSTKPSNSSNLLSAWNPTSRDSGTCTRCSGTLLFGTATGNYSFTLMTSRILLFMLTPIPHLIT